MAKASRRSGRRQNETAYQYRIRRFKETHPGATTQQARGKRQREHVTRKAREIRTHGMTLEQQHRVDEFAIKQVQRRDGHAAADAAHDDPAGNDIVQRYREATRAKGYDHFVRVRSAVNKLGREKRRRAGRILRRKGGETNINFEQANRERDRRLSQMMDLAEDFFDDADAWDLVYYH